MRSPFTSHDVRGRAKNAVGTWRNETPESNSRACGPLHAGRVFLGSLFPTLTFCANYDVTSPRWNSQEYVVEYAPVGISTITKKKHNPLGNGGRCLQKGIQAFWGGGLFLVPNSFEIVIYASIASALFSGTLE